MKKIILIFVLSIFAISCTNKIGFNNSNYIRVGVTTDFPPVIFKENNEIKGIEADYAILLGKYLNKKVKFIEIPLKESLKYLNENKIDILMSGVSVTEERKNKVDFTKPYMMSGLMALIRENDVTRLSRPADLYIKSIRVGFVAKTTGEQFAKRFLENSSLYGFESIDDAIIALQKNNIDYLIHDAPTVWQIANKPNLYKGLLALYRPLTKEPMAWAVKKGNKDLLDKINNAFDKMQKSGELQAIQNKWIPTKIVVK
jgi:ABC-type amino acid transport substrate-binding protein